jgi:Zn-dependent protease
VIDPRRPDPPDYGEYTPRADIPPDSPYHRSARPTRSSTGLVGGLGTALIALLGVLKYGVVAIPFAKTILLILLSFGVYALAFGPWFAVGLIAMLFVHEMGHVVEIRRQGMHATAPVFIPFMGAVIFQRSHPTDAFHQALIGIAGPIAGALGATAAWVLYGATHNTLFLLWAYVGFWINLINLIPFGMLDGGWILAPVSRWFQLIGLAALALGAIYLHLFGLIIFLVLFGGIPVALERFRNARSAYYSSVPPSSRLAIFAAWLALTAYLGFAAIQAHGLLFPNVG